jgi:hypothetical protein
MNFTCCAVPVPDGSTSKISVVPSPAERVCRLHNRGTNLNCGLIAGQTSGHTFFLAFAFIRLAYSDCVALKLSLIVTRVLNSLGIQQQSS